MGGVVLYKHEGRLSKQRAARVMNFCRVSVSLGLIFLIAFQNNERLPRPNQSLPGVGITLFIAANTGLFDEIKELLRSDPID